MCSQYNNWFTFSEYEEPVTVRSCRPIHAKELASVSIQMILELFRLPIVVYCCDLEIWLLLVAQSSDNTFVSIGH